MNSRLLESVASEFGTPVYVYDETKIISQYKRLKNAFGSQCQAVHPGHSMQDQGCSDGP